MNYFTNDEEKKPLTNNKTTINDSEIAKQQLESLKPLKSELEVFNDRLKSQGVEIVPGGIAVNGFFVADRVDNKKKALIAAKEYYWGKYGKDTNIHDNFQWFNPQSGKYEMYTTSEKVGSKLRDGSRTTFVDMTNYSGLEDQQSSLIADEHIIEDRERRKESDVKRQEEEERGAAELNEENAQNDTGSSETEPEGTSGAYTYTVQQQNDNASTADSGSRQQGGADNTSARQQGGQQTELKDTTTDSGSNSQDNTNNNTNTNNNSGSNQQNDEERSSIADIFAESRKKAQKEKTDAEKMQRYYALTDALKILGDMGGSVIGGALSGDAMNGVSPTKEYEPSRGYIEAFEKAKAADEALRKLDQEEYKLELSFEKKKEEREYKEKQAAILQQYKLDIERLRQEYKTANEERRAQIRQEEMAAKAAVQERIARLKAGLKYSHDLSYLDENAKVQMEIIDYKADVNGNSSNGQQSGEKTEPVMFHDNTTMEIPKRYYDSMKRDFVGNDWNGRKVTKDNVGLYIKNNPDVVKAYLESFGVTTDVSSSRETNTTSSGSSGSRQSSSSSNKSSSNKGQSVDDLLNAL